MNRKQLSERDICTKFITPALKKEGRNIQTQVREEVYFTDGRIYVRGSFTARVKRKFADYILYYRPNIPVAVIEARDNNHCTDFDRNLIVEERRNLVAEKVSEFLKGTDHFAGPIMFKNPHREEEEIPHTAAELLEASFAKSTGLIQQFRGEF